MTSQPPRNRGRWTLDFNRGGRNSTSSTDLPNPPGYSASITSIHDPSRQNDSSLRAKRLWDMALGPIKQVSFSIDKMRISSELLLSVELRSHKKTPKVSRFTLAYRSGAF